MRRGLQEGIAARPHEEGHERREGRLFARGILGACGRHTRRREAKGKAAMPGAKRGAVLTEGIVAWAQIRAVQEAGTWAASRMQADEAMDETPNK